jgi:hypothetical protein
MKKINALAAVGLLFLSASALGAGKLPRQGTPWADQNQNCINGIVEVANAVVNSLWDFKDKEKMGARKACREFEKYAISQFRDQNWCISGKNEKGGNITLDVAQLYFVCEDLTDGRLFPLPKSN